jgi:hypothetical protein
MLISKISIPEPCPESWDKMHQTQKGKFCDLCSKEVIDFTKWTDSEVIQYFEKAQTSATSKIGTTCGRLSTQQVERINQILQNHTSQQPNLWRIFAWAFSATALSSVVALQNVNAAEKPVNQEVVSNLINEIENENSRFESEKDTLKQSWVISGTVKSAMDGMPLPGVTVMVKGNTYGTVTDVDGTYKLSIEQFANQSELILQFSFVAMKTYEQKITIRNLVCDVNMEESEQKLNEVVVMGYGIVRRNFVQRVWWRTKNFFKRMYYGIPHY